MTFLITAAAVLLMSITAAVLYVLVPLVCARIQQGRLQQQRQLAQLEIDEIVRAAQRDMWRVLLGDQHPHSE